MIGISALYELSSAMGFDLQNSLLIQLAEVLLWCEWGVGAGLTNVNQEI